MHRVLGLGIAGAIAGAVLSMSNVAAAQDAAAGEAVFKKYCMACHALPADGKNRVGPILKGVVGRHSGMIEGFAYSKANKEAGITWTEDVLFKYLEAPQKFVPGTKMTFAGIKDETERKNVIAFLKSNP